MDQRNPDYETMVVRHPEELFEPIINGMLDEVKRKETERLRKHRELLHVGDGVSGAKRI